MITFPLAALRLPLSRRIAVLALMSASWSPAPACAEEVRAVPSPRQVVVTIDNFSFNPLELTVEPGTVVTWENRDDIPHTVVDTGKAFRSRALDTGDRFSVTLAQAGDFAYFCSLHPHMTGTVKVRGQAAGEASTGTTTRSVR